jgi:hypothetical protein
MSMLAGVIRNSAGELTAFSFALTIFILGYAIWGYIMFGPYLASYRSMMDAIETLIAFALGKYDYRSLDEVNRVFGPLFFFAFFFTVMFLLINIFVAILNESIAAIKKDVSKQSNEYEIVSFMWNRFIDWSGIDFNRILQDIKLKYFLSKYCGNYSLLVESRKCSLHSRFIHVYVHVLTCIMRITASS